MRLFWLVLIISIGQVVHSQPIVETYYPNQSVKEQYSATISGRDTVKDGEYIIYYKDGNVWQSGTYKNNELIGIWKSYYINGNLEQESIFKKSKIKQNKQDI